MFFVDVRNESMLNWFLNTGMELCKWRRTRDVYDANGNLTHLGVEPFGIMSFLGRFIARKNLLMLL